MTSPLSRQDRWRPSKYRISKGRLRASRDWTELGLSSWLIADLIAEYYGDAIPRYASGRLVDLGCGKAPLFEAYRDYATVVVWVDRADSLHPNLDLDLEADLNGPLPFDSGAFDTVILSDVLEHISRPEHLFREVARILAPGGRILMNVPFLYQIHESPHDYYRYTEFALRRFADVRGLNVIVLQPIGGSPEVFADMLAKHVEWVPAGGRYLAWSTQVAARAIRNTAIGRRISDRSGRVFPLGYFMVAERPVVSP